MKRKQSRLRSNVLLWWVAIISLTVSFALYYFLGKQAEIDVHVEQQRMLPLLIGVVIAGICLIAGTAGRWFYPK